MFSTLKTYLAIYLSWFGITDINQTAITQMKLEVFQRLSCLAVLLEFQQLLYIRNKGSEKQLCGWQSLVRLFNIEIMYLTFSVLSDRDIYYCALEPTATGSVLIQGMRETYRIQKSVDSMFLKFSRKKHALSILLTSQRGELCLVYYSACI